jgi:hypothetical protein
MQYRTRSLTPGLVPALALALALAFLALAPPTSASAQSVALDLDLAIPAGATGDTFDLGWGGELRGGYDLGAPLISVTLEAIIDYYSFPFANADASATVMRYGGGVRIGVPLPVVPELFGHLGYGTQSFELAGQDVSEGGLTWDVGAAVNLLPLPILDVGAHVAYKVIVADDELAEDFSWIVVGLHAGLSF